MFIYARFKHYTIRMFRSVLILQQEVEGLTRSVTGIMNFLSNRSRLLLIAFAILLVLFFFWMNRSAYRGLTSPTTIWITSPTRADLDFSSGIGKGLLSPYIGRGDSFRAAGYSYYFAMAKAAGTHYAPYVAGIQVIHLLNVALIFLLARALGAKLIGACAAALLFVFHAAALDVYWKAMYVFELLLLRHRFTLSCLLAYVPPAGSCSA